MLKKKLPTAIATKQSQRLPVKQQARPIEDDDYDPTSDEQAEGDEGHEEDKSDIKKSPSAKRVETRNAGGSNPKSSQAAKFDSVKPSSRADNIPAGKYEAVIKSIGWQKPDGRGQSIRVNYDLCNPEFGNSNQVAGWFRIFDANGDEVPVGIQIFKAAMIRLGYEEPSFDDLEPLFEEINNDNPGVLLNITYSDPSKSKDGRRFQQPNIDSQCDNDVVQEYKDNVAY